jgi:23S rRNA pseudouridine955/2504/2580 synthase
VSGVTTVTVAADEAELRLDRWFKRHFPGLGHGRLEKLLRTGQVRVDGKRAKSGQRLEAGQVVRVPPLDEAATRKPEGPRPQPPVRIAEADAAALRDAVIHRDAEVLALDKPPGLAVQGGTGMTRHLDAMLDVLRFEARERPRLVHRLDKDTSGVLLLARSAAAAKWLTAAFRDKSADKLYWALTVGVPKPRQGRIDLALAKLPGRAGERMVAVEPGEDDEDEAEAGKRAITDFAVVDHAGREVAWVAFRPLTGRTHQIRVHAAALGTPILGDGKYGGKAAFLEGRGLSRKLHLHARRVVLPRPGGGRLDVTAPLPAHMRASWRFFGFDPESREDPFAERR